MLTRALKTFSGRYGMIRQGTVFNCEPGYFAQLVRRQMVEAVKEPPGPGDNRNIPEAPNRATKPAPNKQGSDPAGKSDPAAGTVHPPAAGKATTSASLRADLASRKRMPRALDGGAKKGRTDPADAS